MYYIDLALKTSSDTILKKNSAMKHITYLIKKYKSQMVCYAGYELVYSNGVFHVVCPTHQSSAEQR